MNAINEEGNMSSASEVLKTIKDNDIKYVDLRFTDPRGKMQHVTMDVTRSTRTRSPMASCSTARRSPAGRRSTSPT